MELTDKVVIVTGAGSGVGRALALAFGREGARVVCAARRADRLRDTVTAIEAEGGTGLAIPTDVTDVVQVERMVSQSLDGFGQIDVLFNNAGSFGSLGAVWEVDPDAWWHDVTVNLRGTMLCCRAVLPLLACLTGFRGIHAPVADCLNICCWAYARPPPSETCARGFWGGRWPQQRQGRRPGQIAGTVGVVVGVCILANRFM